MRSTFLPVLAVLLAVSSLARADATTGIWPRLSVPPASEQASAPKDAALIVGIDRYDALPRIPGAADNARDWEKYMLFGRKLPADRVTLLTDQEATVEAMVKAAHELSTRVEAGGTMYIVFIGHGAPASGGSKGLMLGADARPSEVSFASRSITPDKLLEAVSLGKQAQTTLVLDACFSGISNEGKTLIPSIQPVVAVKLTEVPNVTILTAGTDAEYAGSLPGSERPAFSYLVLGGLRGWADKNKDAKVTAEEAVAYARLVLRSMPSNHTQTPSLVTANPEQVLEEGAKEPAPDLAKERTAAETWKPPSLEHEGELRLSARCLEEHVLVAEDGLVLSTDGANLLPAGLQRDEQGEAQYLTYKIPAGAHSLYVKAPGCRPYIGKLDIEGGQTLTMDGSLESADRLMQRAPFGKLNHWSVGLDLGVYAPTIAVGAVQYGSAAGTEDTYRISTAWGGRATFGFVASFIDVSARLGFYSGSWTITTDRKEDENGFVLSSNNVHQSYRIVLPDISVGIRIPLAHVALRPLVLTGGPGFVSGGDAHGGSRSFVLSRYSAGLGADVALLCDLDLTTLAAVGYDSPSGPNAFSETQQQGFWGDVAFSIGVAYAPSSACTTETALERKPLRVETSRP